MANEVYELDMLRDFNPLIKYLEEKGFTSEDSKKTNDGSLKYILDDAGEVKTGEVVFDFTTGMVSLENIPKGDIRKGLIERIISCGGEKIK